MTDPQKLQRIEQLSQMCLEDPLALAAELEAMTEILWGMYHETNSDKLKVLVGMVADLTTIMTTQTVMNLSQEDRDKFLEEKEEHGESQKG